MTNEEEQRRLEIQAGKVSWYLIATASPSMHGCAVQAFGPHDAVAQAKLLGAIDVRPGAAVATTDWLRDLPPRPSMRNRRLDQPELLELALENSG